MTNSFNFVKNHLPTNDRIGFLNVYRSKLPYNAFLQYYPAKDIDNTLEHLDNVNYAAVVIQLTSNTSAGLFVKKSDRQEEIHLQQAEGVIIFIGVLHQVKWRNKEEARMTFVCMF